MIAVIVGLIVLEIFLSITLEKVRKYISVMIVFDVTTIFIYHFMMEIPFLKDQVTFLVDKIIILILSISISLLIDVLFVMIYQKWIERKHIYRYEKQYQATNFEYYRDILKEKSPGILSICYNARKPKFEDIIVGILLYFKDLELIELKKDGIKIKRESNHLKPHEKLVFSYIDKKYEVKRFKKDFYSLLLEDAKKSQYIVKGNETENDMTIFAQMVIVIMILFILITIPLFMQISQLGVIVFLAYFLCFVSLPLYQLIESKINLIIRTEKGLELAGKLIGLKHFLRDFSKMTELKQIELYDEYVIYGVVLNIKGSLDKESKKIYQTFIQKKNY